MNTDIHNFETTLADLEGATNALNNVVQSPDIPIECADGLRWLALQIDSAMCDLRAKWDKQRGAKLAAVAE